MIYLKSKPLTLRPLPETDLNDFAHYRSDPEVARCQSRSTDYTLNQAANLLELMISFQVGPPGN